ncbi:NifB/NifX family molybdenum-iron cluster-binding protein [Candidatus Omnitrophota bacterium]
MKACIPVTLDQGLDSLLSEHFGSAPYLLNVDIEKNTCEAIENTNIHHEHGTCNPAKFLRDKQIDIVLCVGLGVRALNVLQSAGITVYKVDDAKTVRDALTEFKAGSLEEISVQTACREHRCH